MELRDHDHVVECVAWAPDSASEAINEAAAMDNKNRYQYLTYCTSRSDNFVGSVADPESGMGKNPDPGHIFESLERIFWGKIT